MPAPPTHENNALFKELGKDSETALARIHKLYSPLLMACSFQILADKRLAEEIVMDTLLVLWQNRKIVSEMNNPSGWLSKCVYHKSINELDSKKRRPTVSISDELGLSAPDNIQTDLERKEFSQHINQEMEKLPPGQKKIIQLRKYFGLSRKEIARLYKVSEGTVKKQIDNAYKNLRKIMKKPSG